MCPTGAIKNQVMLHTAAVNQALEAYQASLALLNTKQVNSAKC